MTRMVLIVEDSETCAVTLQIALESLPDVEVHVASSGRAALGLLNRWSHPVGVVITDLQLPGMSGLDLLADLRSRERFSSTPVLIISGDSNPRLPQIAQAAGAAAFFIKPYSPSAVRKTVERLLTC